MLSFCLIVFISIISFLLSLSKILFIFFIFFNLSSFILPFAIGACISMQGADKVMVDAFGIVSMVAMTPLITIQLLGFRSVVTKKAKEKILMKKITDSNDEQIINFM